MHHLQRHCGVANIHKMYVEHSSNTYKCVLFMMIFARVCPDDAGQRVTWLHMGPFWPTVGHPCPLTPKGPDRYVLM